LICFGLAAEKLFEQNVFLKGCGLQPHRTLSNIETVLKSASIRVNAGNEVAVSPFAAQIPHTLLSNMHLGSIYV